MKGSLPCGISNTNYQQDMSIFRTRFHRGALIGGIAFSIIVPPFLNIHWLGWVIETLIVIIAVLGLYFVTGLCGQLSIGQAGFVGVGAYATAILMDKLGFSYWLALPSSAIITAIIAFIFGSVSLKVKGFYLAIATFASQYLIIWLITHPPLRSLTGGFDGMTAPPASLGTIIFDSYKSWFFVVIVITWLMIYFAKNIGRTRVGRAFIAVRDNDIAAHIMGINVLNYKLLAFFLSGMYAGIAGALFAPYMMRISPDNFNIDKSIWYVGMLLIGGHSSVAGSIMGVVFVRLLLELTVSLGPVIHFIGPLANYIGGICFSLILILFLLFEPRGLSHRWEIFKASYRMYPFHY
jgi:branched-chain amino acid transport system permease protein